MTPSRPVVLLKPEPQAASRIFTSVARARLESSFEVVDLEGVDNASAIDEALADAFAVVGQPDLDTDRLVRAQHLRAIINVEGNFFPNVDYQTAFQRGIRVLGCGTAYADAVAEMALGLAIDLARGITREDRSFREGRERYVSEGTHDSILLRGSTIGLVGFGNIGRRSGSPSATLPGAPPRLRSVASRRGPEGARRRRSTSALGSVPQRLRLRPRHGHLRQ